MLADSLAEVAALIGDPARARMLVALLDHVELRATDLARHADVSAQTTSFHLRRLCAGGLLTVAKRGRTRIYSLAGPDAAGAIEALTSLTPVANPRGGIRRLQPIELARTCYDHLAGRLGVTLTDALLAQGWLEAAEREFAVTTKGGEALTALGIDVVELRGLRRQFARRCLDWT
ncbi:MAG: ArsR/SmtB family transcription factor, partial [Gemmatimonadaceae bacterium]